MALPAIFGTLGRVGAAILRQPLPTVLGGGTLGGGLLQVGATVLGTELVQKAQRQEAKGQAGATHPTALGPGGGVIDATIFDAQGRFVMGADPFALGGPANLPALPTPTPVIPSVSPQFQTFGGDSMTMSAFKPVRSSMTGVVIGMRARSLVRATNPGSGEDTYWRHVGKPILFSGDARIARQVRKRARKALSATGGR